MLVIFANCILLACYDPLDQSNTGPRNRAINDAEIPFLSIFTADMLIKMIALDLFGRPGGYFTDAWNW